MTAYKIKSRYKKSVTAHVGQLFVRQRNKKGRKRIFDTRVNKGS